MYDVIFRNSRSVKIRLNYRHIRQAKHAFLFLKIHLFLHDIHVELINDDRKYMEAYLIMH